jgi:phosphoribosylformylglycinamidine synthase
LCAHTEGDAKGEPPSIDLSQEAKLQGLLLELITGEDRLALSAHDLSDGGLAVALAECCLPTAVALETRGVTVALPDRESLAEALFGEAPSRVLISADPRRVSEIIRLAEQAGVPATELGSTGGDRLVIRKGETDVLSVRLEDLRAARQGCLDAIVGQDD